jgi:methylated-DNA-[protein]-cysteine S-methyltransferase
VPLIVPCHRVLAAGGRLGGFMGGRRDFPLAVKRWLLRHEGILAAAD